MNAWIRMELARATRQRAPWAVAGAGLGAVGASAAIVPALPETATGLLAAAYHLSGTAELVALNTLLAVWFGAYFAGALGVLGAVALPRAERSLELWLSRPVAPATLVAGRAAPALLSAGLVGLGLTAAHALALRPWLGLADRMALGGALAGGLLVTALALGQLGLLAAVTARVSDLAAAVALSIAVFVAPLLPSAIYVYRPDSFTPPAASLLALPANLIWAPSLALPLLAVSLGAATAAWAGVRLAGWQLGRWG